MTEPEVRVQSRTAGAIPLRRLFPKWGHGSRGEADAAIAAGRVTVNGTIADDPEFAVDPSRDRVAVDGAVIGSQPKLYLKMNKPRGAVTTMRDPEGRRTVHDLVVHERPEWRRAKPVGRLDRDSSGLLLLTTDGDFHFAIAGPDARVEKVYRVAVNGRIEDGDLAPLREGMLLDGERLRPMAATVLEHGERTTTLEMTLVEGRFRQIRRSLSRLGHRVVALERIRIGAIELGELVPGAVVEMSSTEVGIVQEVRPEVADTHRQRPEVAATPGQRPEAAATVACVTPRSCAGSASRSEARTSP